MKALIIDDEHKARKLLSLLITENCREIKTVTTAEDLEKGVAIIEKEQPDLVFLDIEMPRYSGLQILEFFDGKEINFQIIFVTAYNKYAIEAFKLSAIDYLLKPVDVIELKEAITKAIDASKKNDITYNLQLLKQSFKNLSKRKLALEVPRGIIFINYEDILYFEADGMYTKVFLRDNTKELIAKPLKYFVEQLEGNSSFYKPHRSFVVNITSISEFNKKDGGYLVMDNNKKISIARDKKTEFFEVMQSMLQ